MNLHTMGARDVAPSAFQGRPGWPQFRSKLGPELVDLGPNQAGSGPSMVLTLNQPWANLADFGPNWPNPGTKFGRFRPNSGRVWLTLGHAWSTLGNVGPSWTNFGRLRAQIGRNRPKPALGQIWPMNSLHVLPILPTFGRFRASFVRIWPRLGQPLSTSGRRWSISDQFLPTLVCLRGFRRRGISIEQRPERGWPASGRQEASWPLVVPLLTTPSVALFSTPHP